jgi:tetratricopeptide (TPR) repeat protein
VAEEAEGLKSPQGSAAADPAALAFGLAGASRAKADAFLDDQRAMLHLQMEEMRAEEPYKLSHFRLRRFSDWAKAALEFSLGLLAMALVASLAFAVWNASHARGLVVESFAVPPKFAEAGVTGAVLSDDLNSRLGTIRDLSDANSLTRSSDVSASHDDEFRVEIPETGVSLGQAWRYLRLWFGHERRLTGNLRELPDGKIALTATLAGAGAFTATGVSADLDKLEQQAAEHVYQQVDPINYGQYLAQTDRRGEMTAAARRATELAATDIDRGNAFAYFASVTVTYTGDVALALTRNRIATNYYPNTISAYSQEAAFLMVLGHDEEALRPLAIIPTLREEDQLPTLQGRGYRVVQWRAKMMQGLEMGDFAAAASADCVTCTALSRKLRQAELAARGHDMAQSRMRREEITALSRAMGADPPAGTINPMSSDLARIGYYQHAALAQWQDAAADARAIAAAFDDHGMKNGAVPVSHSWAFPLLAVAEARGGDMVRAHADADAMPLDCYGCLRAHGVIAGLEHDWAGADSWFARAVKAAPSIPFAYFEWGRSLLDRGRADEAIAKFALANKTGPHFADPLEFWGEALMAKNQSHLALAKFAEAGKFAPNWGRLHLKWGEALAYAGKPAEARAQFASAAALDLTPSEKFELAQMKVPHG